MTSLRLPCFCVALIVSGCSTPPAKPSSTVDTNQETRRQDLDARLSDAEARVALLKRNTATAGDRPVSGVRLTPTDKLVVSWNGEAAPLVAQLAKVRSLEFKTTGKAIMPIPVAIDVTNADWGDVLRDIGAQLGSRADLILRSTEIELRYRTF